MEPLTPTPDNEVATTARTMTPLEINKRIAIACWETYYHVCPNHGATDLEVGFFCPLCEREIVREGKNYHGDLNAMHEAERGMENQQWWKFVDHLIDICGGGTALGISATSAQRAEAFLRTIGQWEEEK